MQRSMPRSWSKSYGSAQQKRSASDPLSPDAKAASFPNSFSKATISDALRNSSSPLDQHDLQTLVSNMRRIIAKTALQALEVAVNQFEHILRIIEIPLNYKRGYSASVTDPTVTIDQAYALLGSITEILFFLLWRVSKLVGPVDCSEAEQNDDTPECFTAIAILSYLRDFLQRFQIALFACRIPGLPLIHDDRRVKQILTIACTSSSIAVKHHAASLLSGLVVACYAQTGSFTLLKSTIQKVVTEVLFPLNNDSAELPLDALREFIEEMRQLCQQEPSAFQIQLTEFLNCLTTHIKVYEMWYNAISNPDVAHDFEEIEDGLYHAYESISALSLLNEKQAWLKALLRLHITRENFPEAVICKLRSIEVEEDVAGIYNTEEEIRQQSLIELAHARELAERANWSEKEIIICEELLARFRDAKQLVDYQSTLQRLNVIVSKVLQDGASANKLTFAFYRVKFAGEAVPPRIAKCEYIYKRSIFMSVGEFVGEMKAMVRAKYPSCERVDVVAESKPLPPNEDHPNVIFLRVSSVDKVTQKPIKHKSHCAVFKLSTPFTLSGSNSYAKTAEQLKRVLYMAVKLEFPCSLNRQLVCDREEILRCPIETAMDDISKRCVLLRDEIQKEIADRTDLKTLTLVLKGSVDTHVHGGIPEVVDSFLASTSSEDGQDTTISSFPVLMTSTGTVMSDEESKIKRHELANLLVEFVVLCCRCILICRDAFRRSETPTGIPTVSPNASAVAAAAAKSSIQTLAALASESKTTEMFARLGFTSASTPAGSGVSSADPRSIEDWIVVLLPGPSSALPPPGCLPDGTAVCTPESPLQQELERSFAALVALLHSKIRFPFARSAVLPALLRHTESLHMPITK